MKILFVPLVIVFSLFAAFTVRAGSIDEVTFLTKIQSYQAVNDTTLVTQEGKRLSIKKGTVLNVAGFTRNEALVISRKDKPNGFIKRTDIAPAKVK